MADDAPLTEEQLQALSAARAYLEWIARDYHTRPGGSNTATHCAQIALDLDEAFPVLQADATPPAPAAPAQS